MSQVECVPVVEMNWMFTPVRVGQPSTTDLLRQTNTTQLRTID